MFLRVRVERRVGERRRRARMLSTRRKKSLRGCAVGGAGGKVRGTMMWSAPCECLEALERAEEEDRREREARVLRLYVQVQDPLVVAEVRREETGAMLESVSWTLGAGVAEAEAETVEPDAEAVTESAAAVAAAAAAAVAAAAAAAVGVVLEGITAGAAVVFSAVTSMAGGRARCAACAAACSLASWRRAHWREWGWTRATRWTGADAGDAGGVGGAGVEAQLKTRLMKAMKPRLG
jgi:hypothetical protein